MPLGVTGGAGAGAVSGAGAVLGVIFEVSEDESADELAAGFKKLEKKKTQRWDERSFHF